MGVVDASPRYSRLQGGVGGVLVRRSGEVCEGLAQAVLALKDRQMQNSFENRRVYGGELPWDAPISVGGVVPSLLAAISQGIGGIWANTGRDLSHDQMGERKSLLRR
jgi:hypothetical protein